MHQLIIAITFIFSTQFIFSQEHKSEETQSKFTIALSAPYSFKSSSLGINSRFYYNISNKICFGPEFSYFKKDEFSVLDFNFVGHYIFEYKSIGFYPLAGLNYTIENELLVTEKEFGVVFGAGLHKRFNKLFVFGEYSHVQSRLKDSFVTVGIMYSF